MTLKVGESVQEGMEKKSDIQSWYWRMENIPESVSTEWKTIRIPLDIKENLQQVKTILIISFFRVKKSEVIWVCQAAWNTAFTLESYSENSNCNNSKIYISYKTNLPNLRVEEKYLQVYFCIFLYLFRLERKLFYSIQSLALCNSEFLCGVFSFKQLNCPWCSHSVLKYLNCNCESNIYYNFEKNIWTITVKILNFQDEVWKQGQSRKSQASGQFPSPVSWYRQEMLKVEELIAILV